MGWCDACRPGWHKHIIRVVPAESAIRTLPITNLCVLWPKQTFFIVPNTKHSVCIVSIRSDHGWRIVVVIRNGGRGEVVMAAPAGTNILFFVSFPIVNLCVLIPTHSVAVEIVLVRPSPHHYSSANIINIVSDANRQSDAISVINRSSRSSSQSSLSHSQREKLKSILVLAFSQWKVG